MEQNKVFNLSLVGDINEVNEALICFVRFFVNEDDAIVHFVNKSAKYKKDRDRVYDLDVDLLENLVADFVNSVDAKMSIEHIIRKDESVDLILSDVAENSVIPFLPIIELVGCLRFVNAL